jgi:hypothetical protein
MLGLHFHTLTQHPSSSDSAMHLRPYRTFVTPMCGTRALVRSLLLSIQQLRTINAMRRDEHHVAFLYSTLTTSLSNQSSTTYTLKRPTRRATLTCIQSRSRKVRCDATLPKCNRCRADGKVCDFQKSRRGGRPRRPATAPMHTPAINALAQNEHQKTPSWSDISCFILEHRQAGYDSSNSVSTESSTQSVADTPDSASHPGTITLGGATFTRT